MDCLTSFENSSLLDVTSPYAYSADKKPVFNEGARVYTPELCHDFATTFVRCAAGVIAHVFQGVRSRRADCRGWSR